MGGDHRYKDDSFCKPLGLVWFLSALPASAQTGGEITLGNVHRGQNVTDCLGRDVAGIGDLDGDGHADYAVGMPHSDVGSWISAGSVFAYSGLTGAELLRIDGTHYLGTLGWRVAGCGDVDGDQVPDLLVGEPGWWASHVFSGANGSKIYEFIDPAFQGNDFGESLDGAGDVNADGVPDLIVGAWTADPGGVLGAGAAYVYSGADGSMLFEIQGSAYREYLGWDVAGAGDVDHDGHDDVLIGVPGQLPSGAVIVVSGRDGSTLRHWSGPQIGAFGSAVAALGDLDQDGTPDLLVGDWRFDTATTMDVGAVFAYSGRDGSELLRIYGPDGESFKYFGASLAGAGDVDLDGFPDFLAGASSADAGGNGARGAGSAFLYSGFDGRLLARLDGESSWDRFGVSLAGVGDTNGDGRPEWIIGAPQDDLFEPEEGAAYVYSFDPYLYASPGEVSVATGGSIQLSIDFPAAEAGRAYALLASFSGYGPSTLAGVELPLTKDPFFRLLAAGYQAPWLSGIRGILDAQGDATAWMHAPPGRKPAKIGRVLRFAAVSYGPGGGPPVVSAPVHVTVIP